MSAFKIRGMVCRIVPEKNKNLSWEQSHRVALHQEKQMKKWLKRIGGFCVFALIALQLSNPPHPNPSVVPGHDVMAGNTLPPSVAALLKNSCYDCHSYETKWPWYSYIAPVSWSVVGNVNAARDRLNFSDWPHDDTRRVRKRWRHIADEIQNGEMPLPGYTWMHSRARLNAQQRAELVKWAEEQANQ